MAHDLLPNERLILAALDAATSSRTDAVAAMIGKNAAWLWRHGRHMNGTLIDLICNGYVFIRNEGRVVATALRGETPDRPPRDRCPDHSAGAPVFPNPAAGRQLYACGCVYQWCGQGDSQRRRGKSGQHEGIWFTARYGRRHKDAPAFDGASLSAGMTMQVTNASGRHDRKGRLGIIVAAAADVALVDWPATAAVPAIQADIVEARHLITPGAPDASDLTDYQKRVLDAIRRNEALLTPTPDGGVTGSMAGRTIPAKSLAALLERRLIAAPESAR